MNVIHLRDFTRGHEKNISEAFGWAVAAASSNDLPLIVDKGVWETGPIDIDRPCRIIFEEGAVLSMIPDVSLYRPCITRWEGADCFGFHPCFLIHDVSGVSISGKGVIEGNGKWWWDTANRKRDIQMEPVTPEEKELAALNPGFREMEGGGGGRESQFLRPDLFQIHSSSDIRIADITLQNSPFWTLHPIYSSDLEIADVTVHNPSDSPNTDGINIDSCHGVKLHGALVDVGDDGISMKSGCNESGIRRGMATYDVEVWDCTVLHAHGGFVIGSDSSGGVHDILVHDCRFIGTDRGIRMKTRRGRGGSVHDIHIRDIEMKDNLVAFTVNMYYRCGAYNRDDFSLEAREVSERTPGIRDITIERIHAEDCRVSLAFIAGLPESRADGLSISDSSLSLAGNGLEDTSLAELTEGLPGSICRGIRIRNGELTLRNTELSLPDKEKPFSEEDGGVVHIVNG